MQHFIETCRNEKNLSFESFRQQPHPLSLHVQNKFTTPMCIPSVQWLVRKPMPISFDIDCLFLDQNPHDSLISFHDTKHHCQCTLDCTVLATCSRQRESQDQPATSSVWMTIHSYVAIHSFILTSRFSQLLSMYISCCSCLYPLAHGLYGRVPLLSHNHRLAPTIKLPIVPGIPSPRVLSILLCIIADRLPLLNFIFIPRYLPPSIRDR